MALLTAFLGSSVITVGLTLNGKIYGLIFLAQSKKVASQPTIWAISYFSHKMRKALMSSMDNSG
jgi:hypothetical protein